MCQEEEAPAWSAYFINTCLWHASSKHSWNRNGLLQAASASQAVAIKRVFNEPKRTAAYFIGCVFLANHCFNWRKGKELNVPTGLSKKQRNKYSHPMKKAMQERTLKGKIDPGPASTQLLSIPSYTLKPIVLSQRSSTICRDSNAIYQPRE